MSASGRLKAASGDYPRVCKQTAPPLSLSASARFFAIGTKSGIALRKNRLKKK